jgi:CRP-like cAMP-binding protein
MSSSSSAGYRNRLLNALSDDDLATLTPHFEPVDLKLRTSLVAVDQDIEYVHFIESGIASVVASSTDDERIEVGHIGWEGMSGHAVCLGVTRGSTETFMQIAGSGNRIRTLNFRKLLAAHPGIRDLMLRYVYTQQIQVACSALANARYEMRQRLARWLLMCHDRVDGDILNITHEFLSLMLGVRRAGVTGEMHVLEGKGLIKATRGNIRILDRAGIEAMAAGSYGHPETVYDTLIAPRPGN